MTDELDLGNEIVWEGMSLPPHDLELGDDPEPDADPEELVADDDDDGLDVEPDPEEE